MGKKQERREYLPITCTMATHAVSSLSRALSKDPLMLVYGGKKVEVYSVSDAVTHLGYSAKRLFDYMLLLLTKYNRNSGDWTNASVCFTLQDYMEIMGYENTRLMRYKCFEQVKADIFKLGSLQLMQESAWWFGLVSDAGMVNTAGEQATKKDVINGKAYIEVTFPQSLLKHLRECRFIVPFLVSLLRRIPHNENAYALAKRMILHCSQANNHDKANKYRLSVQNLLDACPAIKALDTGNVRRTFEKSMNCLSMPPDGGEPIIEWCYVHAGRLCTPTEIQTKRLSHEDWLALVVEFEPLHLHEGMEYADRTRLDSAHDLFCVPSPHRIPPLQFHQEAGITCSQKE